MIKSTWGQQDFPDGAGEGEREREAETGRAQATATSGTWGAQEAPGQLLPARVSLSLHGCAGLPPLANAQPQGQWRAVWERPATATVRTVPSGWQPNGNGVPLPVLPLFSSASHTSASTTWG